MIKQMIIKKIVQFFNKAKEKFSNAIKPLENQYPLAKYRILTIDKDEEGDYTVLVQLVGKPHAFKMKPEAILADDKLTDSFSPRDIRTLTYLGYLGVSSPKYKILAQRLSEKDKKLVFAIQEKGSKKPIIKSADEITADPDFLKSLDQKDAHMIGFTTASEQSVTEKRVKEQLIEASQKERLLKNINQQ